MVQHYATYVLHLEKALEQIEESLQLANPSLAQQARKLKDKDALKEEKRLTRFIMVSKLGWIEPTQLMLNLE